MTEIHVHPLIAAATELKASAYECAELYRDGNVHSDRKLKRKTPHQILSKHISSFDKHGHHYLPDDPLTDPVHKPRCDFKSWENIFRTEWKVDTARFSTAAKLYVDELTKADVTILPNIDVAAERAQNALKGNAEGLSIRDLSNCVSFGAFLERILYEDGFRSMNPRERFKDLAAFSALLDHAANGDKRSPIAGDKPKIWRANLLLAVFGAYYAYQCGHRSELVRYLRRMDHASDRSGSVFGKFRISLTRYHIQNDLSSLKEVIDRDLAGQSVFLGYPSMTGGNKVNALHYAVKVNMPLNGEALGYGGTIDKEHEQMRFDKRDQQDIFGVFAHALHARHLAKHGRFKEACRVLDDFPDHWRKMNPYLPLSDFQSISLFRGYGAVYLAMYKHFGEKVFLDAAEHNYRKAKSLSEKLRLLKDQDELENICSSFEI